MSGPNFRHVIMAHPLRAVLWLVVAVILVKAVKYGLALDDDLSAFGNDDIMRLLSVRDFINGQSWYDMTQYRLLPPDGVSLHWSRYLDVAIAAMIVPFSYVMPMAQAELVAATVWPTVILIVTVLIVGFGTRRVFGNIAACVAVLCIGFWPLTADLHARPGNFDHHNIQLLLMVILAFAVIWPARPVASGIVGGVSAAFSLAVGLEALIFIVAAGCAVLVRVVLVERLVSPARLLAFCVALAGTSIILMMGQTAPAAWAAPVCDQLGAPVLVLVAVAGGASLLPLGLGRLRQRPPLYFAATVILCVIGLAASWPLLSGCLDGPYGDLPLQAQELINNRIGEARPGLAYLRSFPVEALLLGIPIFASFLVGGAIWIFAPQAPQRRSPQDVALAFLLMLCAVGIGLVFMQMRTVIIAASVVPMIGGYIVARLFAAYLANRRLGSGLLMIAMVVAMTAPTLIVSPFVQLLDPQYHAKAAETENCRTRSSLAALNAVPPDLVLTHLNHGPALLLGTHHFGMSAPYHRSAPAFLNGIVPFSLPEAELETYLRASGARYFLLCRGYAYESDFVKQLAQDADVAWLRPVPLESVPLENASQMLFEILPQ